jgi:hypothetical protein
MPFYQLHLMLVGAVVVPVGASIAAALACRRWPLPWRSLIPKHCRPAKPAGRMLTINGGIPGLPGMRRHRWSIRMTPLLILARAAIIGWTTLAVLPLEIAFDAVESELKRQGVEL